MTDTVTPARSGVLRWFASTPRRTFLLYPLLVIAFDFAVDGQVSVLPWGAIFLVWGYLQYRLAGNYRRRRARGGPGMDHAPEELVTGGPYAYTRNPMYLGHLIFLAGLAITFLSWVALALFIFHIFWFHRRVRADEARLTALFGEPYRVYKAQVARWIPFVI